jgi:hypothetical protein
VSEFGKPPIIGRRSLTLVAAIAVPLWIQAALVAIAVRWGPSAVFGYPYDNYIGLASFVFWPSLGFIAIWSRFRAPAALVIGILYLAIMFILMMYLTLVLGHRFGGDLP